jgi:hypothetical protein
VIEFGRFLVRLHNLVETLKKYDKSRHSSSNPNGET